MHTSRTIIRKRAPRGHGLVSSIVTLYTQGDRTIKNEIDRLAKKRNNHHRLKVLALEFKTFLDNLNPGLSKVNDYSAALSEIFELLSLEKNRQTRPRTPGYTRTESNFEPMEKVKLDEIDGKEMKDKTQEEIDDEFVNTDFIEIVDELEDEIENLSLREVLTAIRKSGGGILRFNGMEIEIG